MDQLKQFTEESLKEFGVTAWEDRVNILNAVQQFKPQRKQKRVPETHAQEEDTPGGKKQRSKKTKLKFKDIDVIANHPKIPVNLGSIVYCKGYPVQGIVVDRNGKACIEYHELFEVQRKFTLLDMN
jgi:hypothetical protein